MGLVNLFKNQQKVDIELSKICQNHQKLSEWQKFASLTMMLHWNCSQIFFVGRLKKMSASFQVICQRLEFSWTRENQQLNIIDVDVGSHKQCQGLLTLLALLCTGNYSLLNTSKFYYLDELYGNELVFILSFVFSNNINVETAEQFILLYTRYVCDFSSPTWRKHFYIVHVLCFLHD